MDKYSVKLGKNLEANELSEAGPEYFKKFNIKKQEVEYARRKNQ